MWRRPSLFRSAKIAAAWLVLAAAVVAVSLLLVKLAVLSLALVAGILFTALLWPVARRLEAWRVPKSLASIFSVLLFVAGLVAIGAWILPRAAAEVAANKDQLVTQAGDLLHRIGDVLPGTSEAFVERTRSQVTDYLKERSGSIASGIAGSVVTAAEIVTGLILALVLAFFFLRDGERLSTHALGALSEEKRRAFTPALLSAWGTLRGWIRAAAIIALVDAVGIGVGLAVLGVPLAFPLAVLTFFGAFIPVVGATVTGALAVLVAWATGGTTDALIAAAIVLAVQQFEGNVLEPVVMGRALPLHPAAVLIAVTAGALLAGIPGAFVAVPLTAVTVSFLREVHARSGPAISDPGEAPQEEGARAH